jgi:hypothetical protein
MGFPTLIVIFIKVFLRANCWEIFHFSSHKNNAIIINIVNTLTFALAVAPSFFCHVNGENSVTVFSFTSVPASINIINLPDFVI